VLKMEKTDEQRAEKRLRYRWHARFAGTPKQKSFTGQMADVSSKGMALLYHADKNCPHPDQSITTHFGVPYFDSRDSFDTVFFNRTGRVCRVDNLSSKVNRIAIQFKEPLFFKPGEQDISDSDAQQRLDAKAQLIVSAKQKAGTQTQARVKAEQQAKSKAEENAQAYSEALARAEEKIRSYAEAKAEAEEKLKAEIEARHRIEAEEKARTYVEIKAGAEEKAKAESRARAIAQTKAEAEVKLRTKAEKKAKTETEKRAKLEKELREKTESHAEQLAKVKAEAAREIAHIKAELAGIKAKIKAESASKTQKKKIVKKKDAKDKAKPSGEGVLMDKVDKLVTDRSVIF